MLRKITAIISFAGGITGIIGGILVLIEGISKIEGIYAIIGVFLVSISTLFYVKWTNFGKNKLTDIEKLDHEAKLLKRQIEVKELKEKLDTLQN